MAGADSKYRVAGTASDEDTAKFLEAGLRVAREAGDMIKVGFAKQNGVYDRKSATDPVTETDRQVEEFVFKQLKAVFPAHSFVGEESAPNVDWGDEPTWVVDPIDGTANFVHRLPHVCISIALLVRRKLVLGVVYNPILEELFHATHSSPAMLNGSPISVSSVRDLPSACIAAEYGSDRDPGKVALLVSNTSSLLRNSAQCLRSFGSCALDMCYVAAGRLDVYCEYGPCAWDLAAGALIVERAGGVVRNATGGPLDLAAGNLLVCNQFLLEQIQEIYIPPVSNSILN